MSGSVPKVKEVGYQPAIFGNGPINTKNGKMSPLHLTPRRIPWQKRPLLN